MRKNIRLIVSFVFLFSVFFMPGNIFAQDVEKDYLNFLSSGRLFSFKKTAPDGSFLEISSKRYQGSPHIPIKVVCTNGEILDAYVFFPPDVKSNGVELIYKKYAQKAESFDYAVNDIMYLSSYDGVDIFYETPGQAVCYQPDGLTLVYGGDKYNNFYVQFFKLSIGDNGDYVLCEVDKNIKVRYFDKAHLSDGLIERIFEVQRHYKDFDFFIHEGIAHIQYKDGSSFTGAISTSSGDVNDWHFWANSDAQPVFNQVNGILKKRNGDFSIIVNGEYDEFETSREKQTPNPGSQWTIHKQKIKQVDNLSRCTHKFDGDWKASYHPRWSSSEVSLVFHVVGESASFDRLRRSPGDPKEEEMPWDHTGDRIVCFIGGNKFDGALVKDKIIGRYHENNEVYDVTFTKYGKGKIETNVNYTKDRTTGLIIY